MTGIPIDTIAAIATAPGRGGVGIVRVSGPLVPNIAAALLGSLPEPRRVQWHVFRDDSGSPIDNGLALYFAAPASFTGESVLELHGHGGQVVMEMLLARVLSLGARVARPGEFSERAFLNDKIDLAQAEAIADLIESTTEQSARAAIRSLEGEFSRQVHEITESLIRIRIFVEAAIDFPDEEIDFLSDDGLQQQLLQLQAKFCELLSKANQGHLLRDGLTLVIAGRPNAGKSSLLNALSGRDGAIVTDIPGTTRDVLHEHIQLDGLPLHLVDTAGFHDSDDPVELAGMKRARAAMIGADQVLLLVDDTAGWTAEDDEIAGQLPDHVVCTRVYNKIDLSGRVPGLLQEHGLPALAISLQTGDGLDDLRTFLKNSVGYQTIADCGFSARQRHLDALCRAQKALNSGVIQLTEQHAGELLAEELRNAQSALGEITGEVSSDELLGRIFSSFCIGK
jgi:tRNA modification GTPase